MKNLFVFFFVLSINIIKAQTISFEKIDSNNVLNIINQENYKVIDNTNTTSTIVTQIGNQNLAEINLLYGSKLTTLQKGDYNTLLYQDLFNPKTNSELSIIAEGNGNYIEVLGSNSISDGMKIKTTGNDRMIFIRNY